MRIAAIVCVFGLGLLGLRLTTQTFYDGRIMPGVVVGGQNLGGLTLTETRRALSDQATRYRLKLDVADQHYELTAAELGVRFDVEATVASAYRLGRQAILPPLHHDPLPLSFKLDRLQLNAFTTSVASKVGTPPIDAGVVVKNGELSTVPEKSGWSIDRLGLQRLIEADVQFPGGAKLSLSPREQLADIQSAKLTPTLDEAKHLMATPIVLTYQDRTYTPRPMDVGQWLTFEKQPDGTVFKLTPKVDTGKLKSYVQTIANELDVAPVSKRVNVENGVSKVTQEGQDGLAIDQDAMTKAISEAVMKQSPLAFTITSRAVAFKTISTTFVTLNYPKYIEINLSKQRLWAWQDGNIVYESPITSGATGAGFPTVTGLFSIYYKTTNTHLVGRQYGPRYDYDVFVKYWMPFYSGYGLHDASWRNGRFGGSDYYYGGSHGCVNMPDTTAEFIYGWAEVGTPVWVHN